MQTGEEEGGEDGKEDGKEGGKEDGGEESNGEPKPLDVDTLEALMKLIPTTEEADTVAGYEGEKELLAPPEQYVRSDEREWVLLCYCITAVLCSFELCIVCDVCV